MPLYHLEPVADFLEDENWSASTHKKDVIVESGSEKQARQIAHDRFWIAADRKSNGAIPENPWKNADKVLCRQVGKGNDVSPPAGAILIKAKP
ncbi:MAG: hypothetical protein RIB30_05155 [Thalassospira sp.]|uniref:hypothetical protein n=1 Tax=Thalassospira sp. TaxID=1912094 RepID=UPI0032EDF27F